MAKYFCTVQGGLEKICYEEIKQKLSNVANVGHIQGRVFWSSDPFDIKLLHSCERIFSHVFFKKHQINTCEEAKEFM